MAERTVFDCDACAKRDLKETRRFHVPTGRTQIDPVTCRTEEDIKPLDLCPGCMANVIRRLQKTPGVNKVLQEAVHG